MLLGSDTPGMEAGEAVLRRWRAGWFHRLSPHGLSPRCEGGRVSS